MRNKINYIYLAAFTLSGCFLMPAEYHLASSDLKVSIDESGYLVFLYTEEELSSRIKKNYELTSLTMVRFGEKEKRDYTVYSDHDEKKNKRVNGKIPLPIKVTLFSKQYEDIGTHVQAKTMYYDVQYNVMIGVDAYDRINEKLHYAAEVDFVIRERNGKPFVEIADYTTRYKALKSGEYKPIKFPLR